MTIVYSGSIGNLFYPGWTLWYLISLFIWKVLVVPISQMRFSIVVSFVVALLVGFSPANQLFSASRTVAFFPLFLIGYKTSISQINKIRKINKIIPIIIIFALFAFVIIMKNKGLPVYAVLAMAERYANLKGFTEVQGMLFRMIALLIGCITTFCLLVLIPKRKSFVATLGKNTMMVYIGQAFFLQDIGKHIPTLFSSVMKNEYAVIILVSVLAAIICLMFGNRWVSSMFNKIINKISGVVLTNENTN